MWFATLMLVDFAKAYVVVVVVVVVVDDLAIKFSCLLQCCPALV
jgi:hypothetical protein